MAICFRIREIINKNGHIKIDEMMRQVLSMHFDSYYRSLTDIGANGDFITAPEISQVFGEIIGLWAIEKWQKAGCPTKLALVELGPGKGMLMSDLLKTAKIVPDFFKSVEIYLHDINPHFIKMQRDNLKKFNLNIKWIESINDLPDLPIILIANEFFDSLPIKQFIKVKKEWFEHVFTFNPLSDELKYDRIAINDEIQTQLQLEHERATEGAVIEKSWESVEMMKHIANHIKKYSGYGLIIDYGYNIEAHQRSSYQYNSTLQAIKNHQYHPIIQSLGKADITAHVDFNELQQMLKDCGIQNQRFMTQRDFLLKYGIGLRFQLLKKNLRKEDSDILDHQLHRLTANNQMGELFKVLEVG